MPERERGAPPQIEPKGLGDYLDVMSKAAFQSGLSWSVIDKKWPGTREAFDGFDAARIADYTPDDIDRLTRDSRVVRNRRKIEAVVHNARVLLELQRTHGSFRAYLRSFKEYEDLARDMRKRFKFLGDMGVYYFLVSATASGRWVDVEVEWMATYTTYWPLIGARRPFRLLS
jgi:3-methyladenine DNA glycosylase Tag